MALNFFTILWGAYVRASGSGAGCGSHWPLCNGQVIPLSPTSHTIIEFTHRIASGLCLIFSVILFVWSRKVFQRGSLARLAAGWTLGLMLSEALLGAGLVLFELVAHNRSSARAASVSLHLINTLLLLGAMSLAFRWASHHSIATKRSLAFPRSQLPWVFLTIGAALALGVSGALTALGDTLFKTTSLAGGMAQDFAPGSHFLIKLRVAHPLIAILSAILILNLAENCDRGFEGSAAFEKTRRWGRALKFAVLAQVAAGALNLALLAPVGMQLLHLALADITWILLVMLGASIAESSSAARSAKNRTSPIPSLIEA